MDSHRSSATETSQDLELRPLRKTFRDSETKNPGLSGMPGFLAFTFQHDGAGEGTLPNGGHNKVTAKMLIIAAYLCTKAITLPERKKEKDAYGICLCIENYHGGYKK